MKNASAHLALAACGLLTRAGCQILRAHAINGRPLIRVSGTPNPAILEPRHAYAMTARLSGVRVEWVNDHG